MTIFSGTAGDDIILGTAGDDVIHSLGGQDELYGLDGADAIYGDDGNDTLWGGAGADLLVGGAGFDTASYWGSTAGVTVTIGGSGSGGDAQGDLVSADIEDLEGSALDDSLTGSAGNNFIDGGTGNDVLTGLDGGDNLYGGAGNDILDGGAGTDWLIGGDGTDDLRGGVGDDIQYGGTGSDRLEGGAGGDQLFGGVQGVTAPYNLSTEDGAHDDLLGGDGDDTIQAGHLDSVDGGTGADRLVIDERNGDQGVTAALVGTSVTIGLLGISAVNVETLSYYGGSGADAITGGAGNDDLAGGAGSDILTGGAGDDMLSPGNRMFVGGNNIAAAAASPAAAGPVVDRIDGGAGIDRISVDDSGETTGMTLTFSGTSATGSNGMTAINVESLEYFGGSGGDTVTGSAAIDFINGNGGNDVLRGGAGADYLNGGDGNDTASYYTGSVGVSASLAIGGTNTGGDAEGDGLQGIDNLSGSQGSDSLTGDGGANLLQGWNGNDVLIGATGKDTLTGGAGADRFVYAGAADSPVGANADRITDFSHVQGDKIDVSAIDANTGLAGDQAFTFIGAGLYTGVAGQLRYASDGAVTTIAGDLNGDRISDFHIQLTGAIGPTAADFVL